LDSTFKLWMASVYYCRTDEIDVFILIFALIICSNVLCRSNDADVLWHSLIENEKKIYTRVLDKIVLNILWICCLYVVNKLASLLTTHILSHTVQFARRIQNTSSTIIDNIYVYNIIINLPSLSPVINDLSDHDVFVIAYCRPMCLEGEGIIKCKVQPPRGTYRTLLSYKNISKLMFLCLIHAPKICTKESVHTLSMSNVLFGCR